jgi:glucose/arabinose dehydrogenase
MKIFQELGALTLSALVITGLIVPPSASGNPGPIKLSIQSIDTPNVQVMGGRGAALARLSDGRLLLGGGNNGFSLYLYDLATENEVLIGRVANQSERLSDSRFAVTDIAVLNESAQGAQLLVSYPQYSKSKNCVSVVAHSYKMRLTDKPSVKRGKLWFKSKPCVPVAAIQHAAGRMAVINKSSAYLTIGDLGFPRINQPTARGDLGSVFKISAKQVEKISQGHRNQQGILLIGSDLYTSEHGPRGGDELNLIEKGKDFGWPAVTYGQPYSAGDYVKPTKTGSHEGYEEPLYNWTPSVAPTELVQLPLGSQWGPWAGQIVMGTLAEQALIFIELTGRTKVGQVLSLDVGERIRDLEVGIDGSLIATTDSGKLLIINRE